MTLSRSDIVSLIREQTRQTVDPIFLRLRTELYGSAFASYLRGDIIPPETIIDAVNQGVQDAVEGQAILSPFQLYTAGPAGIQTGRVVYFDGTKVHHASANTLAHAGKVVGVSSEPAGPNAQVRIQCYSTLSLSEGFSHASTSGTLFLGNNGVLVEIPPGDSAFVQAVAFAVGSNKIFVSLSPEVYGV